MISTLLIGNPKTGKTRSIQTLPGGTVIFSFDRGGWRTLDPTNYPTGKRIKKLKFPPKGNPTLRGWLATGDTLTSDEILVVEYVTTDLISINQYIKADADRFINMGQDFNDLWTKKDQYRDHGICHTVLDSLTTFQDVIREFIMVLSGHVTMSMPDWGLAIDKVIEVVDSAQGTGFDFIMTCHIQADKDEYTGKIVEMPLIFGKQLPNKLLIRFDDIIMAGSERGTKGQEFFWCPVPIGLLQGIGTRSFDDLPMRVEPNFAKLYGQKLVQPIKEEVIKNA